VAWDYFLPKKLKVSFKSRVACETILMYSNNEPEDLQDLAVHRLSKWWQFNGFFQKKKQEEITFL